MVHDLSRKVSTREEESKETHAELRQVCERLDALERRQLIVVDL